ncbi:MAG: hypothetical protein IPL78_27535 [Chloroflexi bacterium]|nr:hypothetical protein [Chloroflexota bacterium]
MSTDRKKVTPHAKGSQLLAEEPPGPEPEILQERLEKQLALLKEQIAQRKATEEALRRESALVRLLQEVAAAANTAESIAPRFNLPWTKSAPTPTGPSGTST